MEILIAILLIIIGIAISWITTCGLVALVCLCFGWAFSWGIATGIWGLICLLGCIFKK